MKNYNEMIKKNVKMYSAVNTNIQYLHLQVHATYRAWPLQECAFEFKLNFKLILQCY